MADVRITRRSLLGGIGAVGALALAGPVLAQELVEAPQIPLASPILHTVDDIHGDLLDRIKAHMTKACEYSLFEPNDALTRRFITQQIATYLRNLQCQDELSQWKVVCDVTNNPPRIINQNRLNVDVFIQPKRSIDYVILNARMITNGMSFEEIDNG